MTTKKATSKYTPAMEKAIRDAAEANGGFLNLASATELAKQPEFTKAGITARGIAAKTRTMTPQVKYEKAVRTAKDGSAVAKKEDIVAEVAKILGISPTAIKSLAKAEKLDLKALVAAVRETVSEPELAD